MLMASCVPHRQWALGVVMERGVRAIENCGSRYAFHVFLLHCMPKQIQTSSMSITASPVPRFGPGQIFLKESDEDVIDSCSRMHLYDPASHEQANEPGSMPKLGDKAGPLTVSDRTELSQ